jgi:AcrR family transcriptional regulator
MMPCQPACPTCAELRASALQLIGAGGIDALTLQTLSARSGLALEVLSRHYPSAAACLSDTYEETAASIRDEFAAALSRGSSWGDGLRLAGRGLIERLARRPNEARLCFVEVLRAQRELLRARDHARRRMVAMFLQEHRRRRSSEHLPEMQFELLVGAAFQAIAAAVAEGRMCDLSELEHELAQLDGVFEPVAM